MISPISLRATARTVVATLALLLFVVAPAQNDEAPGGSVDGGIALSFNDALLLAADAPDVLRAGSQLAIARLELDSARSLLQGSVNASAATSFGDGSSTNTAANAGVSASVNVSANLNVVPFGPRAEATERATNTVTRAENELRTAGWQATILVTRQYAAAAAASRETMIAEASLALAEARRSATRVRLEAGAVNDAEVLQSEIAVAQTANAHATALAQERAALSELSFTLGVAVIGVADDVPEAASLDAILDQERRAERIAVRVDVTAAELAVAEAETVLAAAKRETYPSASLDLSYRGASDGNSVQLGAGFDTSSFQPSLSTSLSTSGAAGSGGPGAGGASSSVFGIGVGVSVPLGGGSANAVTSAEIRLGTARAQLERTLQGAQVEIETLLRNLEVADSQLELADRLLDQAQNSVDASRTRYDLGLVSILDVEDTEITLLNARDAISNARDNRLLTAMDLAVALSIDPMEVLR